MNDKFLVIKYVKDFIIDIDTFIVNLPRKEYEVKNRIINDAFDILELVYYSNIKKDNDSKSIILSKLSMLDFYLERYYRMGIISEKVCKRKCNELEKIIKMIYGWIRSESKCE